MNPRSVEHPVHVMKPQQPSSLFLVALFLYTIQAAKQTARGESPTKWVLLGRWPKDRWLSSRSPSS